MISVIISAYKDRGWLDDCINSVKRQTFKDYEVILSSDGNEELRQYADKNHFIFSLSPKGNHSSALNNAVRVASGEWIKEVHDDDLITENCLTDLWNARGDYDLIYANAVNFAGLNEDMKPYKSPAGITLKDLLPVITCPIHAASWMVRTDVFRKVGGFDVNVDCSEEYEFYINLLTKGHRFRYCNSI